MKIDDYHEFLRQQRELMAINSLAVTVISRDYKPLLSYTHNYQIREDS